MLRPLFRLDASEPHLLSNHVEGYALLLTSELRAATTHWKRQLALQLLMLACTGVAAVAAVAATTAVMLWAVLPLQSMPLPWVLIAAPLVPALWRAWLCRSSPTGHRPGKALPCCGGNGRPTARCCAKRANLEHGTCRRRHLA